LLGQPLAGDMFVEIRKPGELVLSKRGVDGEWVDGAMRYRPLGGFMLSFWISRH
jgi:hypothetical protein